MTTNTALEINKFVLLTECEVVIFVSVRSSQFLSQCCSVVLFNLR